MGNKVFGYQWNAKKDEMALKFSFNLSKKKRSVRSLPDLTLADLDSLRSVKKLIFQTNFTELSIVVYILVSKLQYQYLSNYIETRKKERIIELDGFFRGTQARLQITSVS